MKLDALLAETDWLLALARQLVRDEDRAQDLFQDTLLASIRDRKQVKGPLRPWLQRVAQHLAIGGSRRDGRRQRREVAAAQSEAVPSVTETFERFDLHKSVMGSVDGMKEHYRTVVLLRFWEDLPPREIAARLGEPVETIKTRLKRAMKILRVELDQQHGDRKAWVGLVLPVLAREGVALATVSSSLSVKVLAAVVLLAVVTPLAVFIWPEGNIIIDQREDVVMEDHGSVASLADTPVEAERRTPVSPIDTWNDKVVLRVIDKATGRSLSGVTVVAYDDSALTPAESKRQSELSDKIFRNEVNPYRAWSKSMPTLVTDATGTVRVSRGIGEIRTATVLAWNDTLDGMLFYSKNEDELTLEMGPRVQYRIEVIDAAGHGVSGVQVGWFKSQHSLPLRTVRTAGKQGEAVLRFPFVSSRRDIQSGFVGLACPLENVVMSPVHVDGSDEQTIRLVLPSTGSATVEVRDEEGELFTGEAWVGLDDRKDGSSARFLHRQLRVELRDGRARFERVGLGMPLSARVQVEGCASSFGALGRGPEVIGQSATIVVCVPKGRTIEVRLLNREGLPVTDTPFRTDQVHKGKGRSFSCSTYRTDAQGILRVRLMRAWQEGDTRWLTVVSARNRFTQSNPTDQGLIDLSRSLPLGVTRLPDLILDSGDILGRGTVVDHAGRPVAGANVSYSIDDVSTAGPVQTNAKGEFELRGMTPAQMMKVKATKSGQYLDKVFEGPVGSEQIRLVLMGRGTLHATLRPSPVQFGDGLTARLNPSADSVVEIGIDSQRVVVDKHSVACTNYRPGRYDFVIKSGTEIVFERLGVMLELGENRPTGLQGIDLSGRVECSRVTVVDDDQRPLKWVDVQHKGGSSRTLENGVAEFVHVRGGGTVRLSHPRYRTLIAKGIEGEHTFVMQPALEVVLALDHDIPADLEARVELDWAEDDPEFRNSTHRSTPWKREIRLFLASPGRYEISAALVAGKRHSATKNVTLSPQSIEVLDHPTVQRFTIHIDPAKLEQSCALHRASTR